MTEADALDSTTNNGKKYIATINALPNGTNYATSILYGNNAACNSKFGPFNYPNVVIFPDLQIFANNITFSQSNPTTNAPLAINAMVTNTSNYVAQNFVVHLTNQWDSTIVYPDIIVNSLAPNSSTTVTWNITTPNVPAWCPMQVKVDYTNTIQETNELDNTAIRPFINGNYNLPGSIVLHTDASPKVSTTISSGGITIFGTAHYTGTAVPLVDSSCAGATVDLLVVETGAIYSTYTNSKGEFAIGIAKPLIPGTYHVQAHITDYTLDGNDTTDFIILYVPNPNICPVDFTSSVVLNTNTTYPNGGNTIYTGESVSGVLTITNTGCNTVTASTYAAVSQNGGNFTIPSFIVPTLNPNATYTVAFNNLVFNTAGIYNIAINADNFGVVTESIENNNGAIATINVIPNMPDITINGMGNNQFYICAPTASTVSGTLYNAAGGAATSFSVKTIISKNNVDVDSFVNVIPGVAPYGYSSFSNSYNFTQLGTYTVKYIADFTNTIVETNESNNMANASATILDCKPDLVFSGSCSNGITIQTSNVNYTGIFTVSAVVANIGNTTAIGPIPVRFSISNGTVVDTTYAGNLAPGQTATVYAVMPAPLAVGHTVQVYVDNGNTIPEFVESNNQTQDVMCWEFVPTTMCYGPNFWNQPAIKNTAINLYIAVSQSGMYIADAMQVNFAVAGPGLSGTVNLGNATLNNISKTCFCPHVASLPNNFVFPAVGTYTFTITVDATNAFAECNEANNTYVVTMTATDQSDMRVLSQFINPSLLNPNVGQPITLDISYENIGAQNVNDSMELYVQINNIGFDSVQKAPGLITSDNNTIHFSQTWSSTIPGVHIVRAIIDHDNIIAESNELNNEATRAIIVGSLPNLFFKNITASNLVPAVNDAITITGKIGNDGDSFIEGDVQVSYVTNNLDTLVIGTQHVVLPANDSATFVMPWVVVDNKTTLVAKLINSTVLEATYDDNDSNLQLGAMIVSVTTTPSCNGNNAGTATAVSLGGEPPYTYQWSTGVTNALLTNSAGTYTVTVADNTGQTKTAITTITTEALPIVNVSATPATYLSGSSSILLATGANSYSWLPNTALSTTTGAIVTTSAIASTIYTVTSATTYGCTNTATVLVTVINPISVNATQVNATCSNSSNGSITATSNGGIAPITFSMLPSVGIQTSAGVFSNLPIGTYTVKATDALSNTSTVVINIISSNAGATTSTTAVTANGCYTLPSGSIIYTSGLYTNTYTFVAKCDSIATVNVTINPGIFVHAKVLLSGPYIPATGLMADSLRAYGLIPLTDPYRAAPFNYSGSPFQHFNQPLVQTTTTTVLNTTGNNAIVDWVLIQLRSKTNSSNRLYTVAALLQADGDIVDALDGTSKVWIPNVPADDYFISIRHRNHAGVMTATPITFTNCASSTPLVDFTNLATPLFTKPGKAGNPTPLSGPTRVQNGVRTLYAGNAEVSTASYTSYITYNSLNGSDRIALFNFTSGTNSITGYHVFDVDLNGTTRFNGFNPDRLVILSNCLNSNVISIVDQMPN